MPLFTGTDIRQEVATMPNMVTGLQVSNHLSTPGHTWRSWRHTWRHTWTQLETPGHSLSSVRGLHLVLHPLTLSGGLGMTSSCLSSLTHLLIQHQHTGEACFHGDRHSVPVLVQAPPPPPPGAPRSVPLRSARQGSGVGPPHRVSHNRTGTVVMVTVKSSSPGGR